MLEYTQNNIYEILLFLKLENETIKTKLAKDQSVNIDVLQQFFYKPKMIKKLYELSSSHQLTQATKNELYQNIMNNAHILYAACTGLTAAIEYGECNLKNTQP